MSLQVSFILYLRISLRVFLIGGDTTMIILIPGIDIIFSIPLIIGSLGALIVGTINPAAGVLGFSFQQWAAILGILAF